MRAMSKKNEPTLKLNTMACLELAGRSHKEISMIVGCSREHVTRCLESPVGQDMLDKLRRETQAAIFDPVQDQLQTYAREAMDELWKMRNTVESEKLKKDILFDVLHMGGYRPHTNTDRQIEQLPTIVIGQQNIQVNGNGAPEGVDPLPPQHVPVEVMPASSQLEEALDATGIDGSTGIESPREPNSEGNAISFDAHEVWGREHDSTKADDASEEHGGGSRWKSNPERPEQGTESSELSREQQREQSRTWEPSFTIE